MDSFRRFDDFLIERLFQPVCDWSFSRYGVSNYRLARWLCLAATLCDWWDGYSQWRQYQFGTMMIDLFLLPLLVGVSVLSRREDSYPPGTVSRLRANYLGRTMVLLGNIVLCLFMTSRVWTTPAMSNLFVLIYYLLACDKPKGDRVWRRASVLS